MAVFEYTADARKSETYADHGRVVARDRLEAFDKLRRLRFEDIHLERVEGLSAFFAQFTADVR